MMLNWVKCLFPRSAEPMHDLTSITQEHEREIETARLAKARFRILEIRALEMIKSNVKEHYK